MLKFHLDSVNLVDIIAEIALSTVSLSLTCLAQKDTLGRKKRQSK